MNSETIKDIKERYGITKNNGNEMWENETALKMILLEKKIKSFSTNKILLITSMIINAILIGIALFRDNNVTIILDK